MRPVILASVAQKDFEKWGLTNTRIFNKINELIDDIDRRPFSGLGYILRFLLRVLKNPV